MNNEFDVDVHTLLLELKKARVALAELKKYNRLRNNRDAYLWDIIEWATGEMEEKPEPANYGLE